MVDHIRARINLRLKVQTILESTTGFRVIDVIENTNSASYLYFAAVELFYQKAMEEAFQTPNREVLNEELIVIAKPYIRYTKGDKPLAHCLDSAEQCQLSIINSYYSLMKSVEVDRIKESHENLVDITKKTRSMMEEIILLGLIPGRCRVCRRLGL